MTFNVVCETDASAGRAMATRRGVGSVRHLDARLLSSEAWRAQRGRLGNKDGRSDANDLASERNTPSATDGLELTDGGSEFPGGCSGSKRLSCVNLEREEDMRDERLVPELCGNGHRDPDGVVRRTISDFHFR